MTPENYINPAVFPMTTRGHYSVDTQVEMDMFNLHNARQMLEQGYKMTPEDQKRLAELEAKEPHCGGEGGFHDCGQDCCCCLHPELDLNDECEVCHGEGRYHICARASKT